MKFFHHIVQAKPFVYQFELVCFNYGNIKNVIEQVK